MISIQHYSNFFLPKFAPICKQVSELANIANQHLYMSDSEPSHLSEAEDGLICPSSGWEQEFSDATPVVQPIVDWICPDGKRRWSVVRKNLSIPIGQQFKEGDYHLVIIWLSHVRQATQL